MLSLGELANRLGVCTATINRWRRHGLLRAHAYNDKNQHLYEPVVACGPVRNQGVRLAEKKRFLRVVSNSDDEVHHEA